MIKAKYTVVLKSLLDDEATALEINNALSAYPLYTPPKAYDLIPTRSEINKKILDHYKYREIAFETVGRFIDELKITMCEIMPRYNELFKTVETMAELPSPFDNVDVIEKFEQIREGSSNTEDNRKSNQKVEGSQSSESNSETTENAKRINSETPQGSLDITAADINNVKYADSVNWSKNNANTNGSESSESNSEVNESSENTIETVSQDKLTHTYTKTGNQGVNTYAHDMNEFRTSIIDVVDQIINDTRLAQLFFMVY